MMATMKACWTDLWVSECACARVRRIRLREQMFLIKHIVSRVRTPIMNSSSLCEKAAVKGIMGNSLRAAGGGTRGADGLMYRDAP